jgi:regulator of sirC expression with transglutaminase-like and TPR domain
MGEAIYVHPTEARRQFEEFAARELGPDDLARGALLIALEEYPRVDIDRVLGDLDEIAEAARDRCEAGEPDIFKLGHLHAELFDERGFIGDIANYYDPRNSYLNEVLERKVGLPIALTIIFVHVARRLGLDAVGVGLPGHFIAKVRFELSEVYVDSFHGGRTLTIPDIAEMVSEMSRGNLRLRSEHLRAWDTRETLTRVLANLQNVYTQKGDGRRATAAKERMDMLMAGSRMA